MKISSVRTYNGRNYIRAFDDVTLKPGDTRHYVWKETGFLGDEQYYEADANGGTYDNGTTRQVRVKSGRVTKLPDSPTRPGYTLTGWNTKPDGSGTDAGATVPKAGTVLYAQWERTQGNPTYAHLDCNKTYCAVTAGYQDGPGKTRTIKINSNTISWADGGITGVRLDGDGWNPDASCPDDLNVCLYVSLENQPPSNPTVSAQMPTTGAPEGLSAAGLVAVGIGLLAVAAMVKRKNN